jgi:hypothetical protein
MPKLSKAGLARHRAWLSDWRTPADMAAYVSAVNATMGSADFFRCNAVLPASSCMTISPS